MKSGEAPLLAGSATSVKNALFEPLPKRFSRSTCTAPAVVLEEFGNVVACGGSGVVLASQSGHRLTALTLEQNRALALTPTDELLALPFLRPREIADSLHAYQVSKRGNSLRVMAEAVRWGKRGARVNTISPGIVMTPLAKDELSGPRGDGYRRVIEGSSAKRAGTANEIANLAALLMGPEGGLIAGSNFLMDGGVIAAYWFGEVAEVRGSSTAGQTLRIDGRVATLLAMFNEHLEKDGFVLVERSRVSRHRVFEMAHAGSEAVKKARTYHVVLSFAGAQRGHANAVATGLNAANVHVFYDRFEDGRLWGEDLTEVL